MSKKSIVLAMMLLVATMMLAACGAGGGATEAGAAPNVSASDATVTSEAQGQAANAGNDASGAGDTSGANATGEASTATDVGSGSDGAQGSGGSDAASGATSPESKTGAPAAGDDTGNAASGTGGTADASGNTTDSGGNTGGEGSSEDPGNAAQVATPAVSYTAVSDAECIEIQGQLGKALGVEVNRTTGVASFSDLSGSAGESCRLTVTGTGANFAGVPQTAALIRQTLSDNGWTADDQYAADSPTATIGGLRRDNQLAAYNVEWLPANGITCPADQPISACAETLTPEQMDYTITIDLAQQ